MVYSVRLLHISDLHERGSAEPELWRRRRVLGDAWVENLRAICAEGPVDFLCFTGDVAQSGKESEYDAAAKFVNATLAELGLTNERLAVVPGNHDVNRDVANNEWGEMRNTFASMAPPDKSRSILAPDERFLRVLDRQRHFWDWLATCGANPEHLVTLSHRALGYRYSVRLPRLPWPVHLIGLNSAWLSGDEHDAGKLELIDGQIGPLTSSDGRQLSGPRIGLIHHPLSDLRDGGHGRRLVSDGVDLLLRGHLHDGELLESADPDRKLREVAAGCLYDGHQGDHWPNSCNVITITCGDDGRPLSYDIWVRGWSRRGFWYDDNGLYKAPADTSRGFARKRRRRAATNAQGCLTSSTARRRGRNAPPRRALRRRRLTRKSWIYGGASDMREDRAPATCLAGNMS